MMQYICSEYISQAVEGRKHWLSLLLAIAQFTWKNRTKKLPRPRAAVSECLQSCRCQSRTELSGPFGGTAQKSCQMPENGISNWSITGDLKSPISPNIMPPLLVPSA